MPGDTRLDIPVTIVDDSNLEDRERFLGRLSTSNPNAVIDVRMTEVFIDDNDSKFLLTRKRVNHNITVMPSEM